jgi:hypothetical protein
VVADRIQVRAEQPQTVAGLVVLVLAVMELTLMQIKAVAEAVLVVVLVVAEQAATVVLV